MTVQQTLDSIKLNLTQVITAMKEGQEPALDAFMQSQERLMTLMQSEKSLMDYKEDMQFISGLLQEFLADAERYQADIQDSLRRSPQHTQASKRYLSTAIHAKKDAKGG